MFVADADYGVVLIVKDWICPAKLPHVAKAVNPCSVRQLLLVSWEHEVYPYCVRTLRILSYILKHQHGPPLERLYNLTEQIKPAWIEKSNFQPTNS